MKVVLSPQARADLFAIFDYIAVDNPAAAARITDRILQSLFMLTTFPEMGPVGILPDTRELTLPRLSYRVVYRVQADQIRILGIIHTRRQWPDAP